tara:strand:- start:1546 stop:2502 length:957 start_codon:yes stop_codon:yes gene_type:complete
MNKLKKVGLTALGTALVASSAYAETFTATGGASMTFVGHEQKDTGNGWSMGQEVSLAASKTLENDWTVTNTLQLDGTAGQGNSFDNATLKIDMNELGVLTFAGHGNSGAVNAIDDMLPSANEESWALVNGATTPGKGSDNANNNFTYTNPLDGIEGLDLKITYQPSDGTDVEGSTEYGLTYKMDVADDGELTVGAAFGDNNGATKAVANTNAYAKLAIDKFTIGMQSNESDSDTANADVDMFGVAVSYAINDDMSVSYGVTEFDYENTSLTDQEATGLSISYTSGGMTLSASQNSVDAVGGTAGTNRTAYEINLTFDF